MKRIAVFRSCPFSSAIPWLALFTALLAGCSSAPPQPDWQMNARGSLERSLEAYFSGDHRVEAREFERARAEVARTGRPDLVARAELMRCASRVASLVLEPCAGFEPLRPDAPPAERAYADYLAGRQPLDTAQLPPSTGAWRPVLPLCPMRWIR
jgi:hypothetical protein